MKGLAGSRLSYEQKLASLDYQARSTSWIIYNRRALLWSANDTQDMPGHDAYDNVDRVSKTPPAVYRIGAFGDLAPE